MGNCPFKTFEGRFFPAECFEKAALPKSCPLNFCVSSSFCPYLENSWTRPWVEIQVFDASIRLNFDILLLFPLIFLYHYVALQILYPTLYRQIFLKFFIIVKKRLKAIEV